jgi:uncharacterized protein YegJ (DUF2314 family)
LRSFNKLYALFRSCAIVLAGEGLLDTLKEILWTDEEVESITNWKEEANDMSLAAKVTDIKVRLHMAIHAVYFHGVGTSDGCNEELE